MRLRPALLVLGLGLALVAALLLLLRNSGKPEASTPLADGAAAPPQAHAALEANAAEPSRGPADLVAPGDALAQDTQPRAWPVAGRVVEGETWRALSGVIVQLREGYGVQETTTDLDGRFEFPARLERDDPELACVLEPGWIQAGGPHRLTLGEARGVDELEVVLERGPSERLSGRAIDERTGEPVPALRLHVRSKVGFEDFTTDDRGAFESRGAWPAATWRIAAVEEDGENSWGVGSFERHVPPNPESSDPADGPWVFEVSIGPTYFVSSAQTARGSWHARLVERREDPEIAGRLSVDARGELTLYRGEPLEASGPADPNLVGIGDFTIAEDGKIFLVAPTRFWPRVRLRKPIDGEGPHADFSWVRFPRVEFEPVLGLKPWLEMRSDDLSGRVVVPGTIGLQGGPHRLTQRPAARVRGVVTTWDGAEVPGLRLWLLPDRAWRWPRGTPDAQLARLEELVQYSFDDVHHGHYRLVGLAPGFVAVEREIHVNAGFNDVEPLLMKRESLETVVRGSLLCADEIEGLSLTALLRPLATAPFGKWSSTPVDLGAVGHEPQFHFGGLASTPYELWVVPDQAGLFPPMRETVRPPYDNRAIECAQERGVTTHAIRAVNETGRRLHTVGCVFDVDRGALQADADFAAGEPLVFSDAVDTWRLWARNYRPYRGTRAELGEGEETTVTLQRGWGVALHFRHGAGPGTAAALKSRIRSLVGPEHEVFLQSPVAGVRVSSQFGIQGTADDNGTLVLDSFVTPNSLTVYREGWKVVRVDKMWSRASRRGRGGFHREYLVWMVSDTPEEGWVGPEDERAGEPAAPPLPPKVIMELQRMGYLQDE